MSPRQRLLAFVLVVACVPVAAEEEGEKVRSWNLHPVLSWSAESGFGAGLRLEVVGEPPASRRILVSGKVAQEDLVEVRFSARTQRVLGTKNTLRVSAGHVDAGNLRFFGLGSEAVVADEVRYRGRRSHLTVAPGREWRAGWETRLRLTAARDEAWKGDADDIAGLEDVAVDHSVVAVALVRDLRDVEWEPRAGYYGLLELGTTLPISDIDYRTVNLDLRAYRGLDIAGQWSLALRGLWRVVDGANVPFVLLPTYGGSRARGFYAARFRGAGVVATTAELRWRPAQEWAMVAFVDAGRVGDGAGFAGLGGFHSGVGGGLRLYPGARGEILRFDGGYGGADEGVHIFVGFGHTF